VRRWLREPGSVDKASFNVLLGRNLPFNVLNKLSLLETEELDYVFAAI
jgi:hypothetical protein